MKNNNTLNKINDILNKANPSRLDLVEGCVFIQSNNKVYTILGMQRNYPDRDKSFYCKNNHSNLRSPTVVINKKSIKDVLGQKPTVLEVVWYLQNEKYFEDARVLIDFHNCCIARESLLVGAEDEWLVEIDTSIELIQDLPEETQKQLLELMEK